MCLVAHLIKAMLEGTLHTPGIYAKVDRFRFNILLLDNCPVLQNKLRSPYLSLTVGLDSMVLFCSSMFNIEILYVNVTYRHNLLSWGTIDFYHKIHIILHCSLISMLKLLQMYIRTISLRQTESTRNHSATINIALFKCYFIFNVKQIIIYL